MSETGDLQATVPEDASGAVEAIATNPEDAALLALIDQLAAVLDRALGEDAKKLLQSAIDLHNGMATFESAGVSERGG